MIDIESQFEALKASWVVKLTNSNDSWSFLGNIYLNLLDNHNILRLNFTEKKHFPLLQKIPPFYQDVIACFNKSKICPLPLNRCDIMQQVIWGNRHLTYWSKELKHRVTIYFKEWIHAGIIHVHDLKFIDGRIDCNYVFEKVKNKRNIFHEISTLNKVLAPYRDDIDIHTPVTESNKIFHLYELNEDISQIGNKNSKFFYKNITKQKIETPFQENVWKKTLKNEDLNFNKIYTNKIKAIKDKKIAEFNYKTLHLILPCLDNLKKWRILEYDTCPLCHVKHDIAHLLFSCVKAKEIWKYVRFIFGIDISLYDIIGTSSINSSFDWFLSFLSYCIYKEWLCHYADVNNWASVNVLNYVKSNVLIQRDIYKHLGNDFANIVTYFEKVLL